MPKTKTLEKQIVARLRKKPKTLREIADEIGVPYQQLSKKIGNVVAAEQAIQHEGKTRSYSRP